MYVFQQTLLSDRHPKVDNNETYFKDCDLTNLIFDNVSFYGQNIFEKCILPKSGIRLFDNTDDKLMR
jgi:uncharacterized protein YjbI with pentapeptide repeats